MSSFLGHAVAAIAVHSATPETESIRTRRLWLGWLIFLALFPDIDYVVPALGASAHHGMRVTHSILFCLALPILTYIWLWLRRVRGVALSTRVLQVILAGASHLALDLLVGVTPEPLFWPVSNARLKLPFGLLPSAGAVRLTNPLFYRNLVIEMGVLVPLGFFCYWMQRRELRERINRVWMAALLSITVLSAYVAWVLPR